MINLKELFDKPELEESPEILRKIECKDTHTRTPLDSFWFKEYDDCKFYAADNYFMGITLGIKYSIPEWKESSAHETAFMQAVVSIKRELYSEVIEDLLRIRGDILKYNFDNTLNGLNDLLRKLS